MIHSLFNRINPRKILDIGCGAGKYGALAKELTPDARRIAVEIEEKYVDRFNLRDIYHEVRIGDAQEVLMRSIRENYDLVILGDSIEHMPKSVGLNLLNFLTYRSQYILILAPEFVIQHEVDGVLEEAHISVWSERDFHWHDRWAWDSCWKISLFLLRGYVQSGVTLDELVDSVNRANLPLTAENTRRVVKNAELKLVYRERAEVNGQGEKVLFRPL